MVGLFILRKGGFDMRKNFGKDNAVYPMPVFIVAAYDKDGNPSEALGPFAAQAGGSCCVHRRHRKQ